MRSVNGLKALAFRGAVVASGLAGSGLALAQTSTTFDTTDLVSGIVAAGVAVAAIGAAVAVGPRLLKAAWKWIKGALG